MGPRYLLDTDILSHLLRHPQGEVASRIAAVGEDAICTSIVVAAELRFGAAKSAARRPTERVELVLSALEVVALEPPADRHYAEIRVHLARRATPIGPNDLLIASQARALDLTVVTANVREFSGVADLGVENWITAPRL